MRFDRGKFICSLRGDSVVCSDEVGETSVYVTTAVCMFLFTGSLTSLLLRFSQISGAFRPLAAPSCSPARLACLAIAGVALLSLFIPFSSSLSSPSDAPSPSPSPLLYSMPPFPPAGPPPAPLPASLRVVKWNAAARDASPFEYRPDTRSQLETKR